MSDANLVLISLLGGTALLLYGVRLVGEGLQRAAGSRLRHLVTTLTGNRLRAFLVGVALTAFIQSSSATMAMLIGFASARLLRLRHAIGVILGAGIGSTLIVQLVAFRILDFAPLVVFLGWLLFTIGRRTLRHFGQALFGFGLLLLGMKIVSDGTVPLSDSILFAEVLTALVGQPILLLIGSIAVTALIGSSAAVVALTVSLGLSGVIPLEGAVPVVLGANVGTAVRDLTVAIGAGVEALRVGLAHVVIRLTAAVVLFALLGPFSDLARATAAGEARQIANAHTVFNALAAIAFLPLVTPLAALVRRLVPDASRAETAPLYLNPRDRDAPSVALSQALRESLRLGDVVLQSLRDSVKVIEVDDESLRREVIARDDVIDRLEEQIKRFIVELRDLTPEQAERGSELLFAVINLEEIGDVIDLHLMDLAEKKAVGQHRFSEQGWQEIAQVHALVVENLELATSALAAHDGEIAEKVIRHKSTINALEREYRQTHIARMQQGQPESIDTSSIHLDLLASFKRINSLAAGIAYAVLGQHE